jgi:hypothetical protein
MILDNVWKLTNTVRVGLDARYSHTQRQSTFPDNVCSCCPPCHGVSHCENWTLFLFFVLKNCIPRPEHMIRVFNEQWEKRMFRATLSRWELTTGTLLDSVQLH